MLGVGFALSLAVTGGLGSLAALLIGIRARRIIKHSGGALAGIRMAWWCILYGAYGAVTTLPHVVRLVVEAVNQ